ncbi:flagellar hook-basal body complex protein FliE [Buchnera aphidicola]|uniref:Flagellar hook-basal body complex protein FliE n=1 Tax=Buchnera aphidicola str. USDA (Myzus persicae) TaxID=1009856 RepID=W0P4K2_BUCMP|nr:flagellar hook-basal body complex protein FliE [Buchnera aphidicola]AHG60295.1 Flie [Buchnera aphidicola str. USDA (Myzus persicae)]AHG60873.1 Flie [Buchnera aphidicola str. W106 (Myzus persicae)]AHG61445.1 Flie [Buchnera aphidicola str. G002 (Myzus persicae)]AHG62018.1 Flie [Buchnera aphidicola str. F009 (Myzus persicae)]WAI03019.1 MAG: flagellar hook-basal body complex protein FliE [Buchnera aphidicola (Myzus persicae)]
MFIKNINYHNIHTKINFLNKNINTENNIESNHFIDYIKTALGEISNIQNNAKKDSEKFTLNQSGISLNDVMINLEKSTLSMQMAIQVRNKIISAYQEIMNQQI